MISVKDKVVIITGAGQGLGEAYAETLAADGAKVVVAEINTKTGEEVVKRIKDKGGDAIFVATDVTKYDSVQRMVEITIDTYGRIDALVNNAAIYYGIRAGPFTDIPEEDWDLEMAVNVKGTWNCSRAVAPQLIKQGKGKIVNVSSSLAFEGKGSFMHYVASKGAIVSMTRAMASELAEMGGAGLTVNTLCPGAIAGEASQKIAEAIQSITGASDREGPVAGQLLKRRGTVEDLVGPLLFLVSDASDFMTGSVVVVDGGSSRH